MQTSFYFPFPPQNQSHAEVFSTGNRSFRPFRSRCAHLFFPTFPAPAPTTTIAHRLNFRHGESNLTRHSWLHPKPQIAKGHRDPSPPSHLVQPTVPSLSCVQPTVSSRPFFETGVQPGPSSHRPISPCPVLSFPQ